MHDFKAARRRQYTGRRRATIQHQLAVPVEGSLKASNVWVRTPRPFCDTSWDHYKRAQYDSMPHTPPEINEDGLWNDDDVGKVFHIDLIDN